MPKELSSQLANEITMEFISIGLNSWKNIIYMENNVERWS